MTGDENRVARLLEGAAMICILAVLAARPFVAEMPFRTSQLVFAVADNGQVPHKSPDELLRVTFAMILLAGVVLCTISQAIRRKYLSGGLIPIVLILVFSVWTFIGAIRAVDVRGALIGWFEQTGILLAAMAMAYLVARRPGRARMVVVVLVALAGAIATKACAEVVWEIPQRIESFRENPEKQLAQVGITPGTAQAKMFERRIDDRASLGYFGLSNVFASLLILLVSAAAGLTIEKFASARRSRKDAPPGKGEIHLPTLAAVISGGLFVLSLVALFLTRSKGGIAAGVVAVAVAMMIMYKSDFFARHRRKLLAACAAVMLTGICTVAGWGILRGSLPGLSMQIRWEYWVGSAGVIKEKPVFGTGPGGFGEAYLRHRLPEAAESTKSPHNLIMDAACQYGPIGAAVYLAILVWMFVAVTGWHGQVEAERKLGRGGFSTRTSSTSFRLTVPPDSSIGTNRQAIRWCIFLSLVVFAVRAAWMDSTDPNVLMLEAVIPAGIFAVCLLAAMWTGSALGADFISDGYFRVAVVCGLAGFILHNLVTYTLWMPATATVFWITTGAMVSPALAKATAGKMRIPVAILAIAGLVAAGVWLWRPVQVRTLHVHAAQEAISHGRIASAIENMKLAAEADPLDAFAPAGLAKLYAAGGRPAKAVACAEEAWSRSPTFSNARLLVRALRGIPDHRDEALEMATKAVKLDPMNMWFRLEYAEMLLSAGKSDEVLQQIHEIRRIHHARPTISDLRLTSEELKKLDVMEKRINRRRSDDG